MAEDQARSYGGAFAAELPEGALWVDFSRDASYSFTRPLAYTYKGQSYPVKNWKQVYVGICGLLFADARDLFMGIINGDLPGSNSLAFADEAHSRNMIAPRQFAPGYYLESNFSATDIVRRIRRLNELCKLGGQLRIAYMPANGANPPLVPAAPVVVEETPPAELPEGALWVDFSRDASYSFTRPLAFTYKGQSYPVKNWKQVYVGICGLLFADARDLFMGIINGDLPGSNSLAFADEAHSRNMIAPRQFAPGYYLESNFSATDIVRRIRRLNELCKLGGQLRIAYMPANGANPPLVPAAPAVVEETPPADERWLPILEQYFPDGYILNDLLSQFQAAVHWQERYGEECPLEGEAIDAAMRTVGAVRDERVFVKSEAHGELIRDICGQISDILDHYTAVYSSQVYERYQDKLAAISIYTEAVMVSQLLTEANGRFYSSGQLLARRGQYASVIMDARKLLRERGGALSIDDIAEELWFIPRATLLHCLLRDTEALNMGDGRWMLAANFPLTAIDAARIGALLDEYFLSSSYLRAGELRSLLARRLPSIEENLGGLTDAALFNIVQYYLKERFSFVRTRIAPKGNGMDFADMVRAFAAERDRFTLSDVEGLASELNQKSLYLECVCDRAVRVSQTEFVNKRLMHFDVAAIDAVLSDFCPGDYLPLHAVSSPMLMHLPSCGHPWTGYLLQSYVRNFSKTFRLYCVSMGKYGYYGAMVRRSCTAINSYNALIERVLTDDDSWQTTADVLDLLVGRKYQAQRRFVGIEKVMARAKQNKAARDGR